MMKAGASYGATGENPAIVNSRDADIIIGPMGIVIANSLLGEITPAMSVAIGSSSAYKILFRKPLQPHDCGLQGYNADRVHQSGL